MLSLPETAIEFLGDAITETSARVMAGVFDGDPQPLYDMMLDAQAYEFIRAAMFRTLAMVTLEGELPREEAARFLRACASDLVADEGSPVWDSWQSCIAVLGLEELSPLVEQAFKDEKIPEFFATFEEFEEDMRRVLAGAPHSSDGHDELRRFGDTIQELAGWAYDRSKSDREAERDWDESGAGFDFPEEDEEAELAPWMDLRPNVPVVNPLKSVGRNDPCPCGSGKKYKKCCLNAEPLPEHNTLRRTG